MVLSIKGSSDEPLVLHNLPCRAQTLTTVGKTTPNINGCLPEKATWPEVDLTMLENKLLVDLKEATRKLEC